MKIGIPIGGSWPTDTLIDNVRYAESLGVDYIDMSNRVGPFDRDPLIIATVLAMNTERITVAPYSLIPWIYHPVNVCRAIAQIDEIAPGRVVLGWLPGTSPGMQSIGYGMASLRPLSIMREAVELSKLCLSGHVPPGLIPDDDSRTDPIPDELKINFVGEHFRFTNNLVLPSRRVPVMLSSFAPKMLQLGGEIADEVLTGWFANPGGNEWALEQIAIGAARSGRSLDDMKIHRAIHIAVWPDRDVALETIKPISTMVLILASAYRREFGIKLPFEEEAGDALDLRSPGIEQFLQMGEQALLGDFDIFSQLDIPRELHLQQVVAGTPDDCIEQLKATVIHPRFDVLHFAPFSPPPQKENWRKSVELLMTEIVPALGVPATVQSPHGTGGG